jgi:hypothetical protein
MFTTNYVQGFGYHSGGGYGAAAPSLADLLREAAARQRALLVVSATNGLGAAFTDDYASFLAGGQKATFKDAANIVFCNKDAANRPQCQQNRFTGSAAKNGPVADLQRAADRIMNAIPGFDLGGRQMKGPLPDGSGGTVDGVFTIVDNGKNPIGSRSGYDGTLGSSSLGFASQAMTLAGMLKKTPNPATALAFVSPAREDIYTKFAAEIATYLNDVADNFKTLLDAFDARGNVPAQTPLDVRTIPFVVPLASEKGPNKGLIIGTAAAMVGLTALAAVSAAKKKPVALYEEGFKPAFGRGGRGRRTRRHEPRGW